MESASRPLSDCSGLRKKIWRHLGRGGTTWTSRSFARCFRDIARRCSNPILGPIHGRPRQRRACLWVADGGSVFWGAHAPRVLALEPSPSRTSSLARTDCCGEQPEPPAVALHLPV